MLPAAFLLGLLVYIGFKVIVRALYTVKPNERAVLTSFGRAIRLGDQMVADDSLNDDERERYQFPQLRVIGPGGPYFKWPWQEVHKVDVATQSIDLTWDPTKSQRTIEAVTKDNLTTGVDGQIRFRVAEGNLYAYCFGVDSPLEHVMGYFISVLRERIANFVDPKGQSLVDADDMQGEASSAAVELTEGVSINDLRKNLPLLNDYMETQCRSTGARYGIELDAALITQIDPPSEVDRALSAINSTRNQVAADISTARADAEQQITMSKRAVEIASNNAQAEVAPLRELARTLQAIKQSGGGEALRAYIRNMRIPLLKQAKRIVQIAGPGSSASQRKSQHTPPAFQPPSAVSDGHSSAQSER
ncbi:MAG: SPFH domain-containing protein [Gammaproteobacteria bacterium]|jgi:regulator of protease activity HflC (stomatin/prohibitin superfamily)|nr:SPFH domain-containing protein [Gammaproteobacteria bacterium]